MAEVQYGYDQPSDKDQTQPSVTTQPPPAYSTPYGGFSAPMQPAPVPQQQQSTHTVIVNQPMSMARGPRMWSSNMCDCCNDMGICLCGTFCGCCLATQVSQDMGESGCVPCCVPGWLIALRLKMRTQEKIPGSLMDDCCVTLCCGACTLCQLAREIKFVKLLNAQASHASGY